MTNEHLKEKIPQKPILSLNKTKSTDLASFVFNACDVFGVVCFRAIKLNW